MSIGDPWVEKTQQWLNQTYGGKTGYGENIPVNGKTGWTTINALIRAFQIELGITSTANNFGPSTIAKFNARFPNGIQQQASDDETESNIYGIIQGACLCKGYPTGSTEITKHFYSGTGNAIKKLKKDAGCAEINSTVTLNIMKALLSMNQFVVTKTYGGNETIRKVQQKLNNKYEDYIGLIPCDGVYGREMNKALIIALQKVEGYSKSEATGNFGTGTKSKLPIIPTLGQISEQTEKEAIELVRYALCCNGYSIDIESNEWTINLNTTLGKFQSDMCIEVTGICDTNTWMALLLSTGNPDRNCNACDTAYNMLRIGRLDALKNTDIEVIARYIWGPSKELDPGELDKILEEGRFKFAPIYQEDGTPGEHHFTTTMAYNAAKIARIKAKSFKIPENSIIYFAVDFDALDSQIKDIILPYFKILKDNLEGYQVGIYGTRNVCTQVMDAGYAVTCFVSDLSTGYSGNMGLKMPKNWNFDQFNEISLPATGGNGYFGIDKVIYSGRYPVVTKMAPEEILSGTIDDVNFSGYYKGVNHKFSGNRLKLHVTANSKNSDIPNNAYLIVSIKPDSSNQTAIKEMVVSLNGIVHSSDYLTIKPELNYYFDCRVICKGEQINNGEVNARVLIETKNYDEASLKSEIVSYVSENMGAASIKAVRSREQAADDTLSHNSTFEELSNRFKMKKSLIQTVAMWERACEGQDDPVADYAVENYYLHQEQVEVWNNLSVLEQAIVPYPDPILPSKEDSSTGFAQIFAQTAIKARNWAANKKLISDRQYNYENWKERKEVWEKLKNNVQYNLETCALTLLWGAAEIGYDNVNPYNYTQKQIKEILARYNGSGDSAEEYGIKNLKLYNIFDKY